MLSILFSLHSRCTEFLVCCACVAYKEARGKSHSASYIFTLKRCSGRAFPHKGTHLLQTFTHCIVTQVLGSTTPVVAQKETPLYFILLRSSQPSAIHLSLPYIQNLMHVGPCCCITYISFAVAPCLTLWAWAIFKLVFCIKRGIYSHSTQQI